MASSPESYAVELEFADSQEDPFESILELRARVAELAWAIVGASGRPYNQCGQCGHIEIEPAEPTGTMWECPWCIVVALKERRIRQLERVVCLFYIMARDHLPFGTLNDVIRNHVRGVDGCVYSSAGGEAMARSMAAELLADPEQGVEAKSDGQ